ncbi:MAG: hypothetical protein WCJ23_06755, partial [Verrucomicrobiota bacterium]
MRCGVAKAEANVRAREPSPPVAKATRHSAVTSHRSPGEGLSTRDDASLVQCSMFDVRCSMFDVRCSMFDV